MKENLNNRNITILKSFIDNKDEVFTSEALAKIAKVSNRTIKKDIHLLNVFLSDYAMKIISKTGVGYELLINDQLLYKDLLLWLKNRNMTNIDDIPKYRYERVNYIIKKMLSIDYYLTLENLMDELYISRSTVQADLKEVKEILKDFNLKIITKPNYGILLEGDELAKRLCIAEYFFHQNITIGYFAADNAMFISNNNQAEINYIRDLLNGINQEFNINMSDQSFQNLVMHVLIAIRRWKFYNYIKDEENRAIDFNENSHEYKAALKLILNIQEKYNILLPKSEIIYFYLHYKSKHIVILEELDVKEMETVEKTFCDIYIALQKSYSFIPIDKRLYEENLRLHIPAMVQRLKCGLVMRNPQTYKILEKYLIATHITILISEIIENNFDVKMNINEFAYIVLYTNLLIKNKLNNRDKILFVCGRGRPETITIINELNETNSKRLSGIEVCDVSAYQNKNLDEYDLVLTTVPLKDKGNSIYHYIDGNNLNFDYINRIVKQNVVSFKKIKNLFAEEYFNFNLKGNVRNEVFFEIANDLKDETLTARFWKSEHKLSHETNKGVAFLHLVRPLEKNFIYIGKLVKPIVWNKQWIDLIIFVNIIDSVDLLYLVYYFISEVMLEDKMLNKIKKLKTYEDFINLMSE